MAHKVTAGFWGRALTAAVTAGAFGLLLTQGQRDAYAWPKYSTKEKKPCSYCHVNPAGGGKRNAAGTWYGAHGKSFAGFTPEKAAAEFGGAAGAAAPAGKPAAGKPGAKPGAKPAGKNSKNDKKGNTAAAAKGAPGGKS